MGFFSRLPVPRVMRRAAHTEHAATQAAAPEAVEVANGAPRAASNGHSAPASAAATIESAANGQAGVWHHDDCKVNHRSAEAAAKCRNR
jgi:hypothetical protein